MSEIYPISECIVLHLNAGNDRNGNPRRVYVLAHPIAGYLAAVDEGYEGWGAMRGFAKTVVFADMHSRLDDVVDALRDRVTPRIDTSPSYRKRLLSAAIQANMAARQAIVTIGGE